MRPELIFASRDPASGTVVVGALEGGLEPLDALIVRSAAGLELGRVFSDAHGRAVLELDADVRDERLSLAPGRAPEEGLDYRVRDPATARVQAVCAPIDGVGSVPNDLGVIDAADPVGVVVRSGDNAVSAFDLAHGLETASSGARLDPGDGTCGFGAANPWFFAPLDARRVAVTGYGSGRSYVVDVRRGTLERVLSPPSRVLLDAPLILPRAIDADCDGDREVEIQAFRPRTPQAIAVVGDWLVVGYTNVFAPRLDALRGPILLPGVLVAHRLDDLGAEPEVLMLPSFNPQEIRAIDGVDGRPRALVVASGVLDVAGHAPRAVTEGAVSIVDIDRRRVDRTFALGDFAPGTALVRGDALWVGSLVLARLRRIDLETGAALADVPLNTEAVDSVFRLVELPGGLVGAPSFDTDALHVLDPRTGRLDPPPFFGPLAVGPGRPALEGLSLVARRPGRAGVDFVGPDLFALSALASRIRPIELRKVLGP